MLPRNWLAAVAFLLGAFMATWLLKVDHATLGGIAVATATSMLWLLFSLHDHWRRRQRCTDCNGRGFFLEPTSFGDLPDGLQRIACPNCRGRG